MNGPAANAKRALELATGFKIAMGAVPSKEFFALALDDPDEAEVAAADARAEQMMADAMQRHAGMTRGGG